MTLPTSSTQSKPTASAPPVARTNGGKSATAGGNATTAAAPTNNGVATPKPPTAPPANKTPTLTSTDALLARIAAALERLAVNTPAPNYKRGLPAYQTFDFARLGIRVVKTDADGASVLEWNSHYFTRRAGKGKFGVAVWFSRPVGKGEGEDEECRFERLITFKDYSEAESLPAEARKGASA
jgi:hypothetical protein